MSDGEVKLHKALGVSVRVTEKYNGHGWEKYNGYGWEECDRYLWAEVLVGDMVMFEANVEHMRWMLDNRQDELIDTVLTEFKYKLEGETG